MARSPAMSNQASLTFSRDDLVGGALKRLVEAIIYVAGACDADAAFGKVRLNKVLFEADFESFLIRGVPVTGARYQRLQHGPAPKAMLPSLRELEDNGSLRVRSVDYLGRPQEKPVALREADLSIFSSHDIAFLEYQIRRSWGKTASEVSEASHRIEWKTRANGDLIPYEAVWLSNEAPSFADIERTRELALENGW